MPINIKQCMLLKTMHWADHFRNIVLYLFLVWTKALGPTYFLPKVVRYEITSSREVCFTAKSCIPKGPLLARIWPKITLGGSFGTLNWIVALWRCTCVLIGNLEGKNLSIVGQLLCSGAEVQKLWTKLLSWLCYMTWLLNASFKAYFSCALRSSGF